MSESDSIKEKGQDVVLEKEKNLADEFLEFISPYHVSTNPYELESASADLASLPIYHYKFKKKYRASHVIRPADTNELSLAIKLCREKLIPVTIRSAGTSCFASATPSRGGVIIDVRRINKIHEIDSEKMTVKCGSGISWLNLIEQLADFGLAPKCYPTSFKTSCVAGFIATPGDAGIGVFKYGAMRNTILSLEVVLPNGEIITVSKGSKGDFSIDDFEGTYGIYGAISTVELSLTTLKTSLEIIGYGFSSIKDASNFYKALKTDIPNKPFFISISEGKFEKYSHIEYPKQNWLVWAVLYDEPEETSKGISTIKNIASRFDSIEVENAYLREKWRDISDAEVSIGLSARNLIFQEYWISDDKLLDFIETYNIISKKFKFPTALYTLTGEAEFSRIKIFGLTDIDRTLEFFAVKAFLHNLAVKAFKQGDRLYTIGIVNTFYYLKFLPDVVAKKKILKEKLDPKHLFNSYRITKATMKYWRISLLFKTAQLLYKILKIRK